MSKKTGFTFGEFLIAFVVIGIVAVLTIPLLLKFQHDKDIVSGLEGVRATLAQATKMAETHIGYIEEWDLESMNSTEAFERYYKPYLQIGINCTGSSNHNCWQPTHNFINGELADGGAKYGITGSPDVSFTISNGTNLTLTKVKNIDEKLGVEGNLSGYIVFMADVNGNKEPNKIGHDVFSFVLTENGIVPAGTDNDSSNCIKGSNLSDDYWDCSAKVLNERKRDYI